MNFTPIMGRGRRRRPLGALLHSGTMLVPGARYAVFLAVPADAATRLPFEGSAGNFRDVRTYTRADAPWSEPGSYTHVLAFTYAGDYEAGWQAGNLADICEADAYGPCSLVGVRDVTNESDLKSGPGLGTMLLLAGGAFVVLKVLL